MLNRKRRNYVIIILLALIIIISYINLKNSDILTNISTSINNRIDSINITPTIEYPNLVNIKYVDFIEHKDFENIQYKKCSYGFSGHFRHFDNSIRNCFEAKKSKCSKIE